MIGFYIIVRMLELLLSKETHEGVRVFAFLCMVFTAYCMISIGSLSSGIGAIMR